MNKSLLKWIVFMGVFLFWVFPVYGAQQVRVTYDIKVLKEGVEDTPKEEDLRDINQEEQKMFFHSFGVPPVTKECDVGSIIEYPEGDAFLSWPNPRYDYILKGWLVNGRFYRNSPMESKRVECKENSTVYLVFEKVWLHKVTVAPMKYDNGVYSTPTSTEAILKKDNGIDVFYVYPDSRVTVRDIFMYDSRKYKEWKIEGSYRNGQKGKRNTYTFIPKSDCIAYAVYEPQKKMIDIRYIAQKDDGDGKGYVDCTQEMKDMPQEKEVIYGSVLQEPKQPHFQNPSLEQEYQFQGWRIQVGDNDYPIYQNNPSQVKLRDYHFAEVRPTLCAKYQKIRTYRVTFHLDGGKFYHGGTPDEQNMVKRVRANEKVTPPYDNSKEHGLFQEGHQLVGWTENQITQEPYSFDQGVQRELDLYPIWKSAEPVEVIYEKEDNDLYQKLKLPYFTQIPSLPAPQKQGYLFQGWEQISPKRDFYEVGKDRVIEPILYRARWIATPEKKVKISYFATKWTQDRYEKFDSSVIFDFPRDQEVNWKSEIHLLQSLSYPSYDFEGWFCNGEKIKGNFLTMDQAKQLEARFRKKEDDPKICEVKYSAVMREKNGPYLPCDSENIFYFPTSQKLKKGERIYLPIPHLPGYEFDGWYDGKRKVENPLFIENSLHFIAKFTKEEGFFPETEMEDVMITYYAGEGNFMDETKEKVQISNRTNPFTLLGEIPQKQGAHFKGWYYNGAFVTEKEIQQLIVRGHKKIQLVAHYQSNQEFVEERPIFTTANFPKVTIPWQDLPLPKRDEKNNLGSLHREQIVIFRIGQNQYWKQKKEDKIPFEMDQAPYIKENRTMVPMRYVAEAFGVKVNWNERSKMATFECAKNILTIDLKTGCVTINGTIEKLEPTPEIKNNHLYLPLRTMVEGLEKLESGKEVNYHISWNGELQEVVIIKKEFLAKTV